MIRFITNAPVEGLFSSIFINLRDSKSSLYLGEPTSFGTSVLLPELVALYSLLSLL